MCTISTTLIEPIAVNPLRSVPTSASQNVRRDRLACPLLQPGPAQPGERGHVPFVRDADGELAPISHPGPLL
jgi:hypothetical protein